MRNKKVKVIVVYVYVIVDVGINPLLIFENTNNWTIVSYILMPNMLKSTRFTMIVALSSSD